MWDRKELKAKGKAAFKRNYWKCVLVALILTAILLFALAPAAQATGTDYTVAISGGKTSAYMTDVNGESALRVDVFFNGITNDKLVTALSFDLGFEASKLDYLTDSQTLGVSTVYAVDASGKNVGERSLLVNANNAGKGSLRFVLASDYGCKIKTNKPLISLYFIPMAGQKAGATFTFTLGSGSEAPIESKTFLNLGMIHTSAPMTAATPKQRTITGYDIALLILPRMLS